MNEDVAKDLASEDVSRRFNTNGVDITIGDYRVNKAILDFNNQKLEVTFDGIPERDFAVYVQELAARWVNCINQIKSLETALDTAKAQLDHLLDRSNVKQL